jgi:hypothetical protein
MAVDTASAEQCDQLHLNVLAMYEVIHISSNSSSTEKQQSHWCLLGQSTSAAETLLSPRQMAHP